MKKMTKLLSVILAFVMVLSCMTMMASAAKATYKSVSDINAKNGYSPYGTVTRLDSETRISILFDSLDLLLGKANIKLTDMNILGIKIKLDFRSINLILESLDSLAGISDVLLSIIGGSIKYAKFDKWQTKMTRENADQMHIVNEILEVLSDNTNKKPGGFLGIGSTNKGLIQQIFEDGLSLGLVGNFVPLDISGIKSLIANLPKAIASIALSMFSRQDDDANQRKNLSNKDALGSGETYASRLLNNAQSFVNGLFTKPMNWTSYRVDANGNNLGYTLNLPTEADGTSRYFEFSESGETITQYDYEYAGLLGSPAGGKWNETVVYTKAKEYESDETCETYVFKAEEGYEGDATLKWYKSANRDANGRVQSPYWLPSLKTAFDNGDLSLNINGADSLLSLLYKFAPYLFKEMAPTVLNGSAKKLIAEAFDVEFTKIGTLKPRNATNTAFDPDADLQAVIAKVGNPDGFFTNAQEFYVWEYTDYKVIDGVPYYRYQNTYFKGEIPKNISSYYYMFNWDWNISDDFMNEFIPGTDEFTPAIAGSTWALDGLNNLVKKAIDTMILPTWTVKGKTYERSVVFNWQKGGNDKIIDNLKNCARAFFNIAPEEIVDEYFEDAQFYNAMMNSEDNKVALNGLVCELVKLIMPQIKFPDGIVNEPITAIAAIVVRELCTQLMPSYNFDAMIYTNYDNASRAVLADKSADYWLDTTLYMGVNLGMFYLRNIADIGEDQDTGYYSVMVANNALPALANPNTTNAGDAVTFGANAQYVGTTPSWLYAIDWIVDWALDKDTPWCWHFNRLVDVEGEVNLATYQNPFTKINSIFMALIPDLENLINVSAFSGTDYGSSTWLEKVLKDGLVDSIVNLDVTGLLNMLKLPANSVLRSENIADKLVSIIVKLLDGILKKVAGNTPIIPESVVNVESLLNQNNLKDTVVNLVAKLYEASNTYHVFDPILPIANFFIGWKTDAQTFADPEVYFSNDWGSTYLYQTNAPKLNFVNNASGMLQKHRNANGVLDKDDSAYTIQVTNISCQNGLSAAETSFTVAPGEAHPVALTVPLYNGVTEIEITYKFKGKTGTDIGGLQTRKELVYCSDITDDLNTPRDSGNLGDQTQSKDSTAVYNYRKYEFTQNLFTAVTEYQATVTGTSGVTKKNPGSMYSDANPAANAAQYFEHLHDVGASGFGEVKKDQPSSGYMFKAKAGVTAETEMEYGLYDMGINCVKYGNSGKQIEVDFIYYNDYSIDDVASKYAGYHLKAEGFKSQSAWATYDAALKNVIRLAGVAKKIDYVETIQPQLEPAIKALEKAYKDLLAGGRTAAAVTVDDVQAAIDLCEKNPVNFQDYKLFEYFQYEKQRDAAYNTVNSTKAPAPIEDYVENGVWGNDLIAAIKTNAANANIVDGIDATVVKTTDPKRADEKKENDLAIKDFVPATYSDVEIANQSANLKYYHGFLISTTPNKQFLNKEIAYANAKNYDEALYSVDSWSRYADALAKATDAAANATQNSKIFEAKYELMVAQNKLQLKERSMKDASEQYLAQEIKPLIDTANVILNNFGSADSLYKLKDGVDRDAALAQLVSALGIHYDVTVDGENYEGILYDRSALTFAEYDRTLTAKNKRAVDAAADKLREAIENFVCTASVTPANGTVTAVDQSIRYVHGIAPNSVTSAEALLAMVAVSGGTPVVTASKSGNYGTGTRIDIKSGDALLASYFVVIYGDVNGDGAVDVFDAVEVDLTNCTSYYMGDVYDDAADVDHDGKVDANDYAVLTNALRSRNGIAQ